MTLTVRLLLFGALGALLASAGGEWALGAAAGALAALWLRDRERLAALADRVSELERPLRPPGPAGASERGASEHGAAPAVDVPELAAPGDGGLGGGLPTPEPAPSRERPPARRAERAARPRRPAWSLEGLPPEARRAWDFATGGNPIIRAAVVVVFVGMGLVIRYAVDVGWLSVSVRLLASAVVGLALTALGWRLRRGTPGFGLTVQGGGVAVLYLTVYAAYALYGLVPSLAAVALMAAVAVGCGALAVTQDAPTLAVLGVAGGFAAPVLAGTPEGNHVLLLAYYALLNVGVLGVAWSKGWRSVAVVGFLSTFVTGGLWGGLQYRPALYATVQPFVVLSFAVYLALAVRFALRSVRAEPPERALAVDGALVFGLPAATFVLQAGLVEGVVPYGRAWSAAALAAVYLAGAAVLRQRTAGGAVRALGRHAGVRLLADAFLAVGIAFATLALPLAFQRVVFGAMWVLEGAGLVWVGARQRKGWMRWAGVGLQAVAATVLFAEGVLSRGTFNAESLTGWIVAVGLGLSAYVLRGRPAAAPAPAAPEPPAGAGPAGLPVVPGGAAPAPDAEGPAPATRRRIAWPSATASAAAERLAGRLLLGFALFWWTVTAGVHVLDLAPEPWVLAGLLAAAAASAAAFLGLGRALGWRGLAAASLGLVGVGWALWLLGLVDGAGPTAGGRGLAWLAVLGVTALVLAAFRRDPWRRPAFVGAAWLAATVAAHALGSAVADAGGAWALGAVGAVLVAALALAVRLPARVASPAERWSAVAGLVAAVAGWTVVAWADPGRAAPLPLVPVLNPLGVPAAAGLVALVAARRLAVARTRPGLSVLIGALGFGSLTVAVLRGVHAAGVPWTAGALWASGAVQAGLAVAWTLLALALAVVAVRRESRPLWFFGAAVLALVVGKLFAVDLSQAQALVRIGAFLAVGAIMLLIGYRAPLPPAHRPDAGA